MENRCTKLLNCRKLPIATYTYHLHLLSRLVSLKTFFFKLYLYLSEAKHFQFLDELSFIKKKLVS